MGKLLVVATPIGNLEDITLRALRVLGEADALACEDTRQTRKIFTKHDVNSPGIILSYHEHNEESAGARILELLNRNLTVALCSDSGSPGISDPGYRIINQAIEAGFTVEIIPGASAVIAALLASGLSTASFTFKGFTPHRSGPRRWFLEAEREQPHTLILFESPFRIGKLLQEAFKVFGNRMAAVCVEMTKVYEEIHRGGLRELAEKFADREVKGEITVVIAGNNPKFILPDEPDIRPDSG